MSKEKIIEILEKHPAGLSISSIAEISGLHRNTVARIIEEMENNNEVEMKTIGKAKVYFLKTYSGIHSSINGYHGTNISLGLGISDLSDGFEAAVSAAKQAAMQASKGAEPTFSIVFVSSKYNPQIQKVVQGLNKILGTNWIGCTTDRNINSLIGYSDGTIQVLSIDSNHLHFGVGVSENYRKNPVEEGKRAVKEAIENCPVEKSRFATAQFLKGTKKGFYEIIKNPPYFILTLIGGTYYIDKNIVPGMEDEFLEGIIEYVGPFIPIIGGSSSSDFDKIMNYEGENYVFANGNYYKDGAIVCFVVSDLYFSFELYHGYIPTEKNGVITKVSMYGRTIEEINNKPAIDEYCRIINIEKNEFIKNPFFYIITMPICTLDHTGNIYPRVSPPLTPNLDENKLTGSIKLLENTFFVIGKYDDEKTINSTYNAIKEAIKGYEDKNIVLVLNFNCCVRRFLMREKVMNEIESALNIMPKNSILFGMSTTGEIGLKKNQRVRYNNITSTCLIIFDKLQVE